MTQPRNYGPWLAVLSITLLLSACGIKTGQLDPPAGADENAFPRQYPAPETR